jgi:hypothetical protein
MQQVIRDRLDRAGAASRAAVAVRLLAEAFPGGGFNDPGVWPLCAQLLPHAVAAAGHADHYEVEAATTSTLLDRAESYLHGRARYAEAHPLADRALTLAEATFGPDDEIVAARLGNLATVLADQGNLDGARSLHERALAIREARLGPDHLATVRSRERLAAVVAALDNRL